MLDGTMLMADRILLAVAVLDRGSGVILLASTEDGCGGYGRISIDPWSSIEVRMFGWPMLTPGHTDESPKAIGAMLRLGFVYDGVDWLWQRPFMPQLVPVAAHATGRALAEAWTIIGGIETSRLVEVRVLDTEVVDRMAAAETCGRCAAECVGHG